MAVDQTIARTSHRMRQLLAVAGVLVVIIGLPLFMVPQNSDEYFSWSVRLDLSAAFLGASYLAAAVIEFAASRERQWANARIAVPAVLVFTLLTMIVTLANGSQYNYGAPGLVQSAGTWAWLVVYVVVPPVMLSVLWLENRHGGADPGRDLPIPAGLQRVLAALGCALLAGGLILLIWPSASSWMWPWVVTDLTARAFGAWLVGFGVAVVQMVLEGDWRRVRPATMGAGWLGGLQLVVLLRYRNVPDWDAPQSWIYVAVLVGFVALAAFGWRATSQPRKRSAIEANDSSRVAAS